MTETQISIVTPCYNSESYIEDNIKSVANQSYSNIEHIIMDGGSTDGTADIIDNYADDLDHLSYVSERDSGMYDAIEKGFRKSTGDIYAWLNADDVYFPWTAELVADILSRDGFEWITGMPTYIDASGRPVHVSGLRPYYRQEWIESGYYHNDGLGFIQQESTFWTAELWESKGGFPQGIKLAGDYYLWRQFASEAKLRTIDTVLAARRSHPDQQTANIEPYMSEVHHGREWLAKLYDLLHFHELYSLAVGFAAESTSLGNQYLEN